jgi:CHASE2 domain-containing sensor protein
MLSRSLSVLTLVLLGQFVIDSELVKDNFPPLVKAQLRFHQYLSRFDRRSKRVRNVTVVVIDDGARYSRPLSEDLGTTNRKYLAELIGHAATAQPRVIALDFLLTTTDAHGEESPIHVANDQFLLQKVREVTSSGIPVVLGDYQWNADKDAEVASVLSREYGRNLIPKGTSPFVERRNFFTDDQLPRLTTLGTVNLPTDTRQIPLAGDLVSWDGKPIQKREAFALAIADADDLDTDTEPRTSRDSTIAKAIQKNDFVYGGFLPVEAFPTILSKDLIDGRSSAIQLCRHRIVIIGGGWHKQGSTSDRDLNDTKLSPLGFVPSVYLQANYVEALLSGRYEASIPGPLRLIVEFIAGVTLYGVYHLFKGTRFALAVAGLSLFLFLMVYLFFANFGWYLDFVPMLMGILVHLCYEHFWRDREVTANLTEAEV